MVNCNNIHIHESKRGALTYPFPHHAGHAFTAHARVDEEKGVLVGWSWKTLIGGLGQAGGLEVCCVMMRPY